MSANNRVDRNIEAEKSELESTIEMKLDEIKAYHVKTFNSFDMKISSITSNKILHILNSQPLISLYGHS